MLGNQCGLDAAGEFAQSCEVSSVGFRVGSERQRNAVQGNRVSRANRFQPGQARAAGNHIILRMHLEPQSVLGTRERRFIMLRLQAEPGREDCGHDCEVIIREGLSS